MARGEPLEPRAHVRLLGRRAGDQPFRFDHVETRDARGHRDLVAAERARVRARLPDVVAFVIGDERERKAAADRLRQHDGVGPDPAVLEREHRARAADARLHFVDHERDVEPRGQRAQPGEPFGRRGNHAAFALHRFDDHARGLRDAAFRIAQHRFDVVQRRGSGVRRAEPERAAVRVRIRHHVHVGHQRRDRVLRAQVARQRERARRHPVIAAVERDHRAPAGGRLEELDRRLDRIRAGRPAELHARVPRERGRQDSEQALDEAVLDGRRHVEHLHRLAAVDERAHALDDSRMIVARGERARARQEIEIAAPGRIGEHRARAVRENGVEGVRIGARARFAGADEGIGGIDVLHGYLPHEERAGRLPADHALGASAPRRSRLCSRISATTGSAPPRSGSCRCGNAAASAIPL